MSDFPNAPSKKEVTRRSRSMGTRKLDFPPMRSKRSATPVSSLNRLSNVIKTNSALFPSSADRKSQHLAGGARGRSSSIEKPQKQFPNCTSNALKNQRGSAMNDYRTPLSSNNWTPGSGSSRGRSTYHQSRVSEFNQSIKAPSGFGRSSAVGAKNLIMTDKNVQRQTEKELVEFCKTNGYCNAQNLTSDRSTKIFPLSTNEFKAMFAFFFRYLNPETPDLPSNFPQELPALLKKIGYQAHVSKQTFQTLGTMHSWPNVLSILHFLLQRAKLVSIFEEKPDDIVFPPDKDEQGFDVDSIEPTEKIIYDCQADAYCRFNQGNDDCGEYLSAILEERFHKREGIDLPQMQRKEKELRGIKLKLKEERIAYDEAQRDINACLKTLSTKREDLDKVKKYNKDFESHMKSKADELESLKYNTKTKQVKLDTLSIKVCNIKNECKMQKHINPDDSTRVVFANDVVVKQVDEMKESVKASKKLGWEAEMELSRLVNEIENICRSFNAKLVDVGWYNSSGEVSEGKDKFRLDAQKSIDEIRGFLNETSSSLKLTERVHQESFVRIEKELEIVTKELESKSKASKEINIKVEEKTKQLNVKKANIEKEEVWFREQIASIKNNLSIEQQKDMPDINVLKLQLNQLNEIEEDLQKQRKAKMEEGHKLMTEFPETLLKKRQQKIDHLNKYIEKYKNAVQETVAAVNAENEEITKMGENLQSLPIFTREE